MRAGESGGVGSVKLSEARSVLRMEPLYRRSADQRLKRYLSVEDFRVAAVRKLPRPVFDYIEGGSESERTIESNLEEFRSYRFEPRVLRGHGAADLGTELLGQECELPLVLAPTGFTRMVHPTGELAVSRAARAGGVPYVLSTYGTTSVEAVAGGDSPASWFQLYAFKDEGATAALMDRVWASGCRTLVLTVDTHVVARRLRDHRNGFTIPPQLTPRSLLQMTRHPRWCVGMLRGDALRFENLPVPTRAPTDEIFAYATQNVVSALSWRHVEGVRSLWKGKLALKGILSVADLVQAADVGADAVFLSNHGGRQLDGAISPLVVLPEGRDHVGSRIQIIVDSGVRSGADIATALALGADACAIGRPYLYALAVAGETGVRHLISLLREDLRRTMEMMGVEDIRQLRSEGHEMVRLARPHLS